MTTASPASVGLSHQPVPSRKPSLRSGLRRASSRSQLDRAAANSSAYPSHASSRSQYAANNTSHVDSSDDEIPVPMKLSALTKALLSDGGSADQRAGHQSMVAASAASQEAQYPEHVSGVPGGREAAYKSEQFPAVLSAQLASTKSSQPRRK
ncbi:kinase-like protein [Apiospora arundinis]